MELEGFQCSLSMSVIPRLIPLPWTFTFAIFEYSKMSLFNDFGCLGKIEAKDVYYREKGNGGYIYSVFRKSSLHVSNATSDTLHMDF